MSKWTPETMKAFGELARAMGVDSITICGTDHHAEGDDMAEDTTQPDLQTLDGQLSFLDYHSPSVLQQSAHAVVNDAIQEAWIRIAGVVPDGPGKTRLLHKMQAARMEANCVIANRGA